MLQRWAFERAEFRNVHFRDDIPWEPQDFLGSDTRQDRKAQALQDRFDVMRLEKELAGPLDRAKVPAWALEIEANAAKRNGGG
jgi:hypothetical protein